MFTNILIWTALGIVSGFFVFVLFPGQRKYLGGTVAAGIVGAFVGGIVYSALNIGRISFEIDPAASGVAVVGAGLLIFLIHLLVKSEEGEAQRRI